MAEPQEQVERKPPKLFYSQKVKGHHRRILNNVIRRNARGRDHFVAFGYTKEDGTHDVKTVKPYTAKKSKAGDHLLVGYAKDVGLRSYRTDRIHHIKEASMHSFWYGFEKRAEGDEHSHAALKVLGAGALGLLGMGGAYYFGRRHGIKAAPVEKIKEVIKEVKVPTDRVVYRPDAAQIKRFVPAWRR